MSTTKQPNKRRNPSILTHSYTQTTSCWDDLNVGRAFSKAGVRARDRRVVVLEPNVLGKSLRVLHQSEPPQSLAAATNNNHHPSRTHGGHDTQSHQASGDTATTIITDSAAVKTRVYRKMYPPIFGYVERRRGRRTKALSFYGICYCPAEDSWS